MSNRFLLSPILIIVSIATCQVSVSGQAQSAPITEKAARAEVEAMVNRLLQQYERNLGQGVRASWAPLPSSADLAKIVAMGDHAIPALEELLQSEDARTCSLAVRLICARGSQNCAQSLVSFLKLSRTNAACRTSAALWLRDGPESVVGEIRDLAERDSDVSVRRAAVMALANMPWDSALPTLKEVSEKDVDADIRKVAQQLISDHKNKGK